MIASIHSKISVFVILTFLVTVSLTAQTIVYPEGAFIIRSLQSNGRDVLLITGGDAGGTLYGACRFAEHLGVGFGLAGDAIPDGWTQEDYLSVIFQLPKFGMNFVGFHTYMTRYGNQWMRANDYWLRTLQHLREIAEYGTVRHDFERAMARGRYRRTLAATSSIPYSTGTSATSAPSTMRSTPPPTASTALSVSSRSGNGFVPVATIARASRASAARIPNAG